MAPVGFDWDKGNREKNWVKHRVTMEECEQVFGNGPRLIADDPGHSRGEVRYSMLGKTDGGRRLRVIYTIRGDSVRVISARDQSKKERSKYEQAEKAKEA